MINEYAAHGVIKMVNETEILGENPPQCHFIHHKSHMS
jgi:hypothetical protein